MSEMQTRTSNEGLEIFADLVKHYNLSFREIERTLTSFAITQNLLGHAGDALHIMLVGYLSIIKVRYPAAYKKIISKKISYEDAIKETGIESLSIPNWDDWPIKHPVN